MAKKIERAAVLGSGVMGTGIAALLAGAGIRTLLLDIAPKEGKDRNAIAKGALKAGLKANPSPFYSKDDAKLIEVGNFDDDLAKLADCDWVIEVIIENLEIKKSLLGKVAEHVGPDAILSTNTSGISVSAIAEDFPESLRKRWLGTHFFNPPRYMNLLELIPGDFTSPEVMEQIATFGRNELGKGIVYAKNTPNFIGNRIGCFGMLHSVNAMKDAGLRIDQVDAILGPAVGRPKTAVYKTADLVGIDTLHHVAKNILPEIPKDPYKDVFEIPDFVEKLVADGKLGNKTRGGFYTKKGKDRFVLDANTGEYIPLERVKYDSVEVAKGVEDVAERVKKFLMDSDDEAAQFAWKTSAAGLMYSARMIPEVADSIVEIDRAMRWGYNWELGPFETWDALGVKAACERMKKDGIEVPENVEKMLAAGVESFYDDRADGLYAYDLVKGEYAKVDVDPKQVSIPALKKAGKTLKQNTGAHLLDMGDGVLLCEFHTKMNSVDGDIVGMMNDAVEVMESGDWKGLVFGNHADAFSAGANLLMVYMYAQQKQWDDIGNMIHEFQQANLRLRRSSKPVVAAVGGLALGGGCEIAMHCDSVVFAGEAYVGLVEVGVGLIPGGGGCKEMARRLPSGLPKGVTVPPLAFAQKAFENIALAKVATSGKEAIENGVAMPWESRVVLNRDHIIEEAKQQVLGMSTAGYRSPGPQTVKLAGGGAYGALLVGVDDLKKGGFASEHDAAIAKHLAKALTGGDVPEGVEVDEQYLLDLEREGFLALCGEEKTQKRIEHMLMKNRPLRN